MGNGFSDIFGGGLLSQAAMPRGLDNQLIGQLAVAQQNAYAQQMAGWSQDAYEARMRAESSIVKMLAAQQSQHIADAYKGEKIKIKRPVRYDATDSDVAPAFRSSFREKLRNEISAWLPPLRHTVTGGVIR